MKKKFQIFISSTYTDLIDERQMAVQTVLKKGHIPAGMELFKADDRSQKKIIEKWLEESDIYMLILGARYGSMDPETNISYTEWEYDKAVELNKPRFVLILDDSFLDKKNTDYKTSEVNNPKYIDFKSKITNGHYAHFVSNIDQISLKINESVDYIIEENEDKNILEGWIKGHYLEEINRLKEKNKDLYEKVISRSDTVIELQHEMNNVKDLYIGDYDFDYLKRVFSDTTIPVESIEKAIISLNEDVNKMEKEDPEDTFSYKATNLSEINNLEFLKKDSNNSLLSILITHKESILRHNFPSSGWNIVQLYDSYFLPKIRQFSLGDYSYKNTVGGGKSRFLELNDNGKKFISLLEME